MKPTATRLYWMGPCNVLVPCNIKFVSWFDCNSLTRDGTVTEITEFDENDECVPDLSNGEYLEKYAYLDKDGHYHYKHCTVDEFLYDGNKDTDYFWVGPYGMLVISTVSSVLAENGIDTHHSDGPVTDKRRDTYLKTYASSNDDNIWYYISESCNKKRRLQ